MIQIIAIFVGEPRTITDEKGTWESAIYRHRVEGEIELGERGLAGDRVADTKHHGRPGQAVCVHPVTHYDFWNDAYELTGARCLGPGSVGENWTISGGDERTIYAGDIYRVGSAVVQVSGPRGPCWKQERKLGLEGFLKRTFESMRTGFYFRVLHTGVLAAGDRLELDHRLQTAVSLELVNRAAYQAPDPELIARVVDAEGLAPEWKDHLRARIAARS